MNAVLDDAELEALRMISCEKTLLDKRLLDTIAVPLRLTVKKEAHRDNLQRVFESIVSELPLDLRPNFQPLEGPEDGSYFLDSETGVCLALHEAAAAGDEPWLLASTILLVHAGSLEADWAGDLGDLDDAVNKLNRGGTGCIWGRNLLSDGEEGGGIILGRAVGAAVPAGPRVNSWRKLVSLNIIEALRARELADGERTGPATAHLRLLSMGSEKRITAQTLRRAANAFHTGLTEKLRDVVFVEEVPDGVSITLPFRTERSTLPLRVYLMVNDEDDSDMGSFVDIYASMYTTLPTNEVVSWLQAFNGTSDEEEKYWYNTTPWTLGAWFSHDAVGQQVGVGYRGRIDNYMTALVDLDETITGVVREVWATSSKYRLHEEFKEVVGGLGGAVQ